LLKYNRKIKNKNIGYFLVNRRVFSSLRQAEEFCDNKNLDVDYYILSESADVLKEAKEICLDVIPLLRDIKESIQEKYDTQREVFSKAVDEFKKSEQERDMLRDYKEQRMRELMGELRGISAVIGIIDEQIQVHEQVRHLHV